MALPRPGLFLLKTSRKQEVVRLELVQRNQPQRCNLSPEAILDYSILVFS